jgi:hypothetical protein
VGCYRAKGPSWLDKVEFIIDYAVDGCGTTLKVWVDTGIQADKNLVMSLAGISMTEGAYTLLRPKMGRSERHGRTKGPRGKAIGKGGKLANALLHGEEAIPDSADLVANTVKLITGWERPVYTGLTDAFFEIAKPLVRTGYYVTIVTSATDFGYDWFSGILLSPGSNCDRGRFSRLCSTAGIFGHPYENLLTGFPLIPDKDVVDLGDMLRLPKGKWIIDVEIFAETNGFPYSDGNTFTKMMLGPDKDQQCGSAEKLDYEANGGYYHKKFARVVQGPEFVSIWQSNHADNPLTQLLDAGAKWSGFRIQEP